MFNLILAIQEKDVNEIIKPLLQVLNVVTPALLGLVGAIGAIFVILLGVKYARADDQQEHEKAKKGLRNAIIGFILIFVLLIALQIAVTVFTNWYKNYDYPIIG